MLDETPVVLVVGSDPHIAELYATWLGGETEEYVVRTVNDERGALTAVDEADVVVLCGRSPDLSPAALLDALEERDADVQTVAVTDDDHGDLSPAPDDRLAEPVSATALREAVSGLLARRAYVRGVDELYSTAAERAAVESEQSGDSAERRRELEERVDELRRRVDDTLDSLVEASGFAAAYRAVDDGTEDDGD